MLIKDLIKELKKFPPDALVLFSTDEEGNYYHRKADISETSFRGVSDAEYPDDVITKNPIIIYPLNSEGDFQ